MNPGKNRLLAAKRVAKGSRKASTNEEIWLARVAVRGGRE